MPVACEDSHVPSDSPINNVTGRDHFAADDFAAADAIVSDLFARGGQPAIAYGIVAGGELVHSAGFGARVLGAGPPDANTVFRIASMSKSFTASAILLLRDAGRAGARRPGRPVRARAGRLDLRVGRRRPGDDQAAADDDGRVPDRRPVGGPAAGAADHRVRPAAGGRGLVQLGAGDPVRVLQPRLRDPRPGADDGVRRALRRVHQDPAAGAARPGPDRLQRRRVRPGEPGRRLPARARRLGRGAVRPLRRVRADGRRVLDRRRPRPLGGRVRGRVPARRRPRRRDGSDGSNNARRTRSARRRAGRCSCRRP